jgi:alginate O-acetyltransferase complex protein AlgI
MGRDLRGHRDGSVVMAAVAIAASVVAIGLLLDRMPPRFGWQAALVLAIGALVATERVLRNAHPALRMLGLAGVLLYSMKNLVCIASSSRGEHRLPLLPRLAFTLAWFGMNPRVFERRRSGPLPGGGALLARGLRNAAAGAVLVFSAHALGGVAGALLLMAGFSLIVHFGVFHALAALWRSRGRPCHALFAAPWRASTLHEFWTRRWNIGFAEMTALLVQRPVASRAGAESARVASFAFSGLLHELAISVPVRAGYGLPMAYFVLQALAAKKRGHGRWWTLCWVLLPAPLVFHPWFVAGVVMPLIAT